MYIYMYIISINALIKQMKCINSMNQSELSYVNFNIYIYICIIRYSD